MQQNLNTEYIDLYHITPENFWVALEHIGRYEYAAWFTSKRKFKRVLDIACANGFGCEMLSESASAVVGVDANGALIDQANTLIASLIDRAALLATICSQHQRQNGGIG